MAGETTNYKIKYSSPVDKIREFPSQVSKPGAETIDKILFERLLSLKEHGSSFTAASGELVKCTAAITITLPSPTINTTIGVVANGFKAEVTAGSNKIYGGGAGSVSSTVIEGTQTIIFQADGTNWYAINPSWGLEAFYHPTSVIAKHGEFLLMNNSSEVTVTLPAPLLNAVIALYVGSGSQPVKIKATGKQIFGDFTNSAEVITLVANQHILLQANGEYWFILAGEPKREQPYTNQVLTVAEGETGITPSTTRPTAGTLTIYTGFKSELFGVSVVVGGKNVGTIRALASSEHVFHFPITVPFIPPGALLQVLVTPGSAAVTETQVALVSL